MDNTLQFINVVKRYDAIYNVATPEYKNFEAKGRAWMEVADEIGITVDAAKRKWKNLRDSYTKYLRSFRIGTKTSKKYQFWAHADHMEFLKPHQGPARIAPKPEEPEENDSDIGFQVLKKVTTPEDEEIGQIPLPLPPPLPPASPAQPIPAKVLIQPSFIMAKNVASGFVTQIPTMSHDNGSSTTQTTPSPIVAKIRAITTPAPLSTVVNGASVDQGPPAKMRKLSPQNAQSSSSSVDKFDVGSLIRANRELDATCLFFLSLAKSVRMMPKRYQAMVKMRCMRIVSDAEVEIESNFECDDAGNFFSKFRNGHQLSGSSSAAKSTSDTVENGNSEGNTTAAAPPSAANENSEHFLYVMSPSRVEAMIDVSSEDGSNNGAN